ncbi:MAG: septum formation protein Maf [Dehalococcoidia bacterium]|nr:septum formation protein Maf [Dehalococcoidia bacterium]
MTRVILASASPRRRELLTALIDEYDVVPSDVDETMTGDPHADAVRLAEAKARAVAQAHPGAVVIGSDTIVHDGTRPYGKPGSPEEAAEMLRALRGRRHVVVTGVAVVSDGDAACGWSEAGVTLATLPDDAIAGYVASGRPLDKAGSYAIQDEDVPTVAALDGCYCCVVGLPLWRLRGELVAAGVACRTPDTAFARCAGCPERPAEEGQDT